MTLQPLSRPGNRVLKVFNDENIQLEGHDVYARNRCYIAEQNSLLFPHRLSVLTLRSPYLLCLSMDGLRGGTGHTEANGRNDRTNTVTGGCLKFQAREDIDISQRYLFTWISNFALYLFKGKATATTYRIMCGSVNSQ